jgi:hypothetical protein
MTVGRKTWFAVASAFSLSLALAALTYREGRRLTFDGYHYCELAKQFAAEWPDRFGNHWPFGYPLAGAMLGRLGLPAFESLVLVSAGALLTLFALVARVLPSHPFRILILAALGAAPIVAVQFFGILTELPFAATLLALAVCLAHWPARAAIWGAAAFAVIALTIRYAGVIALAILGAWVLWRWLDLKRAHRHWDALGAVLAASATSGALLFLNVLKAGHASGAGRGSTRGLAALPRELVDFGWSAPSALITGGLRDRIGIESTSGLLLGGLVFAFLAGLCVAAWLRPRSDFSRPLALTAFGYATGMGVLHCIGEFDALYNARTFLPALFPLALVAVEQCGPRRSWVFLGCAGLLVTGTVTAVRGISREVGGDVRPAVAPLRARLRTEERIAINDHAFSLSAHLAQRTTRVFPEYWTPDSPERFVVIAAKPRDRSGSGDIAPEWRTLLAGAVAKGVHRYLVESPGLVVLERITIGRPGTMSTAPSP